jgi:hypothetical protein
MFHRGIAYKMKNTQKKTSREAKFRTILISLIFISLIFMLNFVSAQVQTLPTVRQGSCIKIAQTCANCTTCYIDNIIVNNEVQVNGHEAMVTTDNIYYNLSALFCNNTILGEYVINTNCDVDGTPTPFPYNYFVTETGDTFQLPQALILLGQFGLIALFFGIGMTFRQEKWKLKTFFFIVSLLMGIILLNSIRIIVGTSGNLQKMGNMGLILGIIVLSFMFLYMLISYTVEIFGYFKNKKDMKWSVSGQ